MIKLWDQKPFAVGGTRACYVHPNAPDKCLKIMLVSSLAEKAVRRAGVTKELNPKRRPDENRNEFEIQQKLIHREGRGILNHMPVLYGFEDTDLGEALVSQFFSEADGTPALTLKQYLRTRGVDETLREAMHEFRRFLLRHPICAGDLHPSNLVLWEPTRAGRRRVYIVDGIAEGGGFFLSRFRFLQRLAVARRIRRLNRRTKTLPPDWQSSPLSSSASS